MSAGFDPAEKKKEKRDFEIGTKLMRRFRKGMVVMPRLPVGIIRRIFLAHKNRELKTPLLDDIQCNKR